MPTYILAFSFFVLIPLVVLGLVLALLRYMRRSAAGMTKLLEAERAQLRQVQAEMQSIKASFALCAQEVGLMATTIEEVAGTDPGLRCLSWRADLIRRMYETHTSLGAGPFRVLDLNRLLAQAAHDVRPLDATLVLPPMQVPVMGVHRDLVQSLSSLMRHVSRRGAGEIHVKVSLARTHVVLSLWSEGARAHVTQPTHAPHTPPKPTLESHLATRLLRSFGATVQAGSGPDITLTFPLTSANQEFKFPDTVSGNIPVEPMLAPGSTIM